MRVSVMVLAFLGLIAPAMAAAAAPEPVLRRSIPLPGVSGRIDHLACDPQAARLFIAALENGSLEAVDLDKGERIKAVSGLKEPQGIVYVAATRQVVIACGGDGTVRAFDSATLEEKQKVVIGEDADNMRLDADGRTIAVGFGGGAIAFLDAATLAKTGQISLSGHPEAFELEPGTTRLFVNVPGGTAGGGGSGGAVAVGDRAAGKVTVTWRLTEAGRNFPMALDAAHQRLYVGCRRAAKLLVIDTESGKVLASPECVGDADEVFVDAKTGRVLVIGGEGAIDVFETKDQQAFTRAASVKTASGARTGLLVAERRAIYLAVPKRSDRQAEIREYTIPE